MLHFDPKLLAANKETEICSIYVAADSIERSLAENASRIKELARAIHAAGPQRILLLGSGASYCTLYTGYYFLRTCSGLPAVHAFGPELVSDDPPTLKAGRSFAILSSYSGKTADTLEASRYLGRLGIPRLALSREEDGPLARSCEYVLPYRDKCLYTTAMANLLLLLVELVSLRGEGGPAAELSGALAKVPGQMRGALEKSDEWARGALERVKDDDFFYVLGDGALWALAYQFGYTNLMEYSRVHAACLRSCEWRHGPLEVLFRKPAMILFLGGDSSREYGLATRRYCEANGARVISLDAKEYFQTHPVLAPFAVHLASQFFFLYQSTLRGINMDDYLEMHVKPYREGETYF